MDRYKEAPRPMLDIDGSGGSGGYGNQENGVLGEFEGWNDKRIQKVINVLVFGGSTSIEFDLEKQITYGFKEIKTGREAYQDFLNTNPDAPGYPNIQLNLVAKTSEITDINLGIPPAEANEDMQTRLE